ncbi:HlyD family secretion protein [Chondromyces apiculatus]|uniref:Multidrug efflux MFS membrane fusion protein, putative n=1 Tax=Chondromyces apiculatus DSM 436 TaxID=1192034 RepID=A0A017SY58_9BACT|nr:HlyD family efflux transporter periplasmic adaptor subunit [Chondromyces apiculatus]EYF01919.1 multidrug efflux MFS membrane fusion protein, putative [Chondromyces apiculatus DSM 436]
MPAAFERCLESIEPRGRGRHAGLLLSLALMAGWSAWFFRGEVAVFRASASARVESTRWPRPVVAEVAGRVARSDLALGRSVAEGDVLVELDATSARLQLSEERVRRDVVVTALDAARAALDLERALTQASVVVARANARTASAHESAAAQLLSLSDDELSRVRTLNDASLLPKLTLLEREMSHAERAASLAVQAAEARRAAAEVQVAHRGGAAHTQELLREVVDLDGQLKLKDAAIARLEREVTLHVVRAPTSGVLGDIVSAPPGDYVTAAQRLGTLVPGGALRVVAELAESDAAGIVHPGQAAVMRLDSAVTDARASVSLTVTSVGEVSREGRLRVELESRDADAKALAHGQTGVVEIDVARTSPFELALRLAGRAYAGLSRPEARR